MTMIVGATAVDKVFFNGVELEKVYMNGVLVFEKATNALMIMLTVEPLWDGAEEYGYAKYDNAGAATPNILATPLGDYTVDALTWAWNGGHYPTAYIELNPIGSAPLVFWWNYSIKVHIAGHTIDFSTDNDGGIELPPGLFDHLPLSGTHSIILEVINYP